MKIHKGLIGIVQIVALFLGLSAHGAPPWNFANQSPTWPPPVGYLPSPEYSRPVEAIASANPLQITLRIFVAGTYDIYRKNAGAASWGSAVANVTVTAGQTWIDANITEGQQYEYKIKSGSFAGYVLAGVKVDQTQPKGRFVIVVTSDVVANLPSEYAQYKADLVADGWVVDEIVTTRAVDYTSNGTGPVDSLGAPTGPFPSEHINIREQIIDLYEQHEGQVKNVILLGKVAVARSGTYLQGPDGHGNRAALGADAYYADMDGIWTDTKSNALLINGTTITGYTNNPDGTVTFPASFGFPESMQPDIQLYREFSLFDGPLLANIDVGGVSYQFTFTDGLLTEVSVPQDSSVNVGAGTVNVAGDNKFDADYLSDILPNGSVELGFGRVDMSSNIANEYEAIRAYLNKAHRYKVASTDFLPGRRAVHRVLYDQVAYSALLSMPGVVGMDKLDFIRSSDLPVVPDSEDADAAWSAANGPYLFYFKGNSTPDFSDGGKAVFWTGLQSHWGYWFEPTTSSGQNVMQKRLSENNFTLSYTWSIFGSWYLYQRMGLGYDLGDMMRFSISDKSWANGSQPNIQPNSTYIYSSPLFMQQMGDPSLRLFMFAPPTDLSVVPSGGNPSLSWTASRPPPVNEPQIIGYHVYRAATAAGPFTRITTSPVAATTYTDTTVNSGSHTYMVRAVRLETTGAGSYYNASLGVSQSINLTSGPSALQVATTSLPDANWNNPYQAVLAGQGGTPVYAWTLLSGSLPPGLTLAQNGTLSGTPAAAGVYSFTVRATDKLGVTADKALVLTAQSNGSTTLFPEAANFTTAIASGVLTVGNPDPWTKVAGPAYGYETFMRFDLNGLNANNSLVRAKLLLNIGDSTPIGSYALVKAALCADTGDGWNEFNTATKSITAVANNGAGKTRVTCPGHGMTTQTTETTTLAKITGANSSNANGVRSVTIIDANTFDLPTVNYDATLVWTAATSAPLNGLKYTNRPMDNVSLLQTAAASYPVAYRTIEIDVTPFVTSTLSGDPLKKMTVRLFTTRSLGFTDYVGINSRLAPGNSRPRLIIETTNAPAITITSPTVNPVSISVGSPLVINTTVTPIPAQAGSLTVQWSKLSGPGTITFGTPALASTTATFPAAGDYVLRLTANDGLLTSTKDLTVRVLNPPAGVANISGPVLDPSLILRLPFDEVTGTSAADVSGVFPANNGTLASLNATLPSWVTQGKVGGALNFVGTGQRVEINDSTTSPLDGMQKLTASLWVKLNVDATTNQALLVKRATSTASTTSYAITLTNGEKVAVSVANLTAVTGDTTLTLNQWHHVLMVYDGSRLTNNLQLYINGNPDKFGTISATGNVIPRNTASKLRVGDYTNTAVTASFNGQIDEVRLYNRVLTLDEIQVLSQAQPANMGPRITLTPPTVSGTAGQPVGLGATVTDDGLPGALTLQWQKASGPGSVVFSDPVSGTTDATPSTAGSYGLRLLASDGSITTFADVAATFEPGAGGTGIASWRQLHFGTTENTGNAADDANPMGDGLRNLLKYALGLNPNVDYRGSGLMPKGQLEEVGGQEYLTYTFTRNTAVSDVTLSVEVVNDLTSPTWGQIDPLLSVNQVEVLENTPSAGIQTITVKDTQPVGSSTKRFMRLKVVRP
jgi:hypothetical protein